MKIEKLTPDVYPGSLPQNESYVQSLQPEGFSTNLVQRLQVLSTSSGIQVFSTSSGSTNQVFFYTQSLQA